MGGDRLGRARLGALLGAGGLLLAACAQTGGATVTGDVTGAGAGAGTGVASAARAARAPSPPVTATPSVTAGPIVPIVPSSSGPPMTPDPGSTSTPASTATASATPRATPSASVGKGEGTLRVLTYQGHVEYGSSAAGVNWVSSFEKRSGCVVRVDRVRTGEEMASRFAAGTYDVVSPSPDLAGLLVADGKVMPLDTSLIPEYRHIPKRLRELPGLREDGRAYGVPYLWGVNRVIHEGGGTRKAGALYGGDPAALRDSPLSIADAALVLRETRPELDIGDPFQLTPDQLDAAVELLAEGDGPDRVYWQDSLDLVRALSSGPVRIAQALPYHLDLFRRAGRQMKAAQAGPVTGWVDSWMISAASASPNCAYRWLDWTASEGAQRPASAWTGLAPANPEACGGHARRMCDIYRVRDGKGLRDVLFASRPARDCGGRDGTCTDYADWTERWRGLVK
ncbi:extracellular solute-binding protein [Streptosporangium sp. DT93]|uniref:extracellular solute-binding protein n=1 Tax=Streptosporangium sp. DT93 TaxID=3393428 RepID=UPI003CFAF120